MDDKAAEKGNLSSASIRAGSQRLGMKYRMKSGPITKVATLRSIDLIFDRLITAGNTKTNTPFHAYFLLGVYHIFPALCSPTLRQSSPRRPASPWSPTRTMTMTTRSARVRGVWQMTIFSQASQTIQRYLPALSCIVSNNNKY
jgi:hypothetical protein